MKIHAQRSIVTQAAGERGVALITTLLIMMLMSALLIGFTTMVMSDQRYRLIDRDRSSAFYGAESGIEKLTSDLGNDSYEGQVAVRMGPVKLSFAGSCTCGSVRPRHSAMARSNTRVRRSAGTMNFCRNAS